MNSFYTIPKSITLLVLFLSISACSSIKSYFPDKQKEYVNSVEIAPLVIPPDLSTPVIPEEEAAVVETVSETVGDEDVEKKSNKKNSKKEEKSEPERVRLISYAGGATRLQIDEPFVQAWRTVGKSLTRKSLEIIDRNINDGLFLIQYDPNEKDIEDGSLWDEVVFLFGDDKSNEQEYQIRLVEDRGITEVLVLDQQGTPQSQGVGLTLLNLMHDTIKADLAGQQ